MTGSTDGWVSQIRKGVLEMAVLSLLATSERYGSEIVETLKAHPELAITAGTVYPLMARLKKAGTIDSTWRESPVGPPRKYYRLTPTGAAQLSQMASAWRGVSHTIDGLLKGID